MSYEKAREIALTLANVEDGLSYGAPALKVGGKKMFVRWREEMNAIVVRTTFEEREELMDAEPEVYFITDHFLNYKYVLVNLARVTEKALGEIIRRSYAIVTAKKK